MRCTCIAIAALSLIAVGCSDSPAEGDAGVDSPGEDNVTQSVDFTDWPLGTTGTMSKPKYGQGCRYKAVDGELWELAADGDNDRLTLLEPVADEVNLTLYAMAGTASVMLANVEFQQRHLPGKAYYEATGSLQFGEGLAETWTVLDGTLCFQHKVLERSCVQEVDCPSGQPCVANVCATGDIAGEFSLIAQEDGGEGLRTVGGTFTLSEDAISGSDLLNVNDDAIALQIP